MSRSAPGLLKPNISALVGNLYGSNDPRRDSGFSIFYMGINIGAVMAPLVCGYLAQSEGFRRGRALLASIRPPAGTGVFCGAEVGMILGLIVYVWQRNRLIDAGHRVSQARGQKADATPPAPLTRQEWKRVAAIFVFSLFTILCWAA